MTSTELKTTAHRIVANHSRMPHYQAYYWLALSTVCKFSVKKGPWWYKVLPSPVVSLDFEAVCEQVRPRLGMNRAWNSSDLSDFSGSYIMQHGGKTIKFVIDAHDLKDIIAPEALDWCDIYFKANKWATEVYSEKVLPIVNGNGFLRQRHLKKLKKFRDFPKRNDIVFISRIWGGMEHNVKLFEELATLPGDKRLVAIFVKGNSSSYETKSAMKRLEQVGVDCTYDLMSINQLWKEMAQAKLVFLRAGKHMCIPWRMIDLLCMGSCIVTDSDFFPVWPEKLEPGVHYLTGGIDRPIDTSSASSAEYGKLREIIGAVLDDEDKQNQLRLNSSAYFDNHAAPDKVGKLILSCLRSCEHIDGLLEKK